MSEVVDLAKKRVEEVVSFFGINVEVEAKETDDGIELDIAGSASTPRLIGHRGETLRAIEYLVNQMVKRDHPVSPRVLLDVAGYREARKSSLEEMARTTAATVQETGEEVALRPMNPAERRIVHMALREIPEVHTESRGDDRSRHIVVMLPKEKS